MKRIIFAIVLHAGMISALPDTFITDYIESRDKKAIVAMLEADCYQLNYCKGSEDRCLFGILNSERGQIKVLREDNTTVGFCAYDQEKHNYNDDYTKYDYYGKIHYVVTDYNHRKKGHATLMLQSAIDDLSIQKICEIALEVGQNNASAIALYRKKGFEFIKSPIFVEDPNSGEFALMSRVDTSLCDTNYEFLTVSQEDLEARALKHELYKRDR